MSGLRRCALLIGTALAISLASLPAGANSFGDLPETPAPKPRRTEAKPASPTPAKPAAKSETPSRKSAQPAAKPDTATPLRDGPLRVQVVRSALPGCEPNCLEWISVEGRIDTAGRIRLAKVVAKLGERKLPIFIDSAGGLGDDGMAMGRLARKHRLDVVVARTVLEPCTAGDADCRKLEARGVKLGQVTTQPAKCLSACAFVLAGGARRFAGPNAFVGLHDVASYSTMSMVRTRYRIIKPMFGAAQKQVLSREVVSSKQVRTTTSEKTYVDMAGFFAEMGISDHVMTIIHKTPHEKIYVLTPPELESTKLATHRVTGRSLETANQEQAAAQAPVAAKAALPDYFAPKPAAAPPCVATAGLPPPECFSAAKSVLVPAPAPKQ